MMRPGQKSEEFWTIPPLQTIRTDLRSGLPRMDCWLVGGGKILIVLSDSRPDDIIVRPSRTAAIRSRITGICGERYGPMRSGSFAVRCAMLSVFAGREKDLARKKKIFGRDFAYPGYSRIFSCDRPVFKGACWKAVETHCFMFDKEKEKYGLA